MWILAIISTILAQVFLFIQERPEYPGGGGKGTNCWNIYALEHKLTVLPQKWPTHPQRGKSKTVCTPKLFQSKMTPTPLNLKLAEGFCDILVFSYQWSDSISKKHSPNLLKHSIIMCLVRILGAVSRQRCKKFKKVGNLHISFFLKMKNQHFWPFNKTVSTPELTVLGQMTDPLHGTNWAYAVSTLTPCPKTGLKYSFLFVQLYLPI